MKPQTIVVSFDVGEQVVPRGIPGFVASLVYEFSFQSAKATFHRETDRVGAISRASDASARVALFEAAHVMLTRSTKWSSLKAWAVKLAQRRGLNRAKVALARKLAVILHRIWQDQTDFRFTAVSTAETNCAK